MPDLIDDDELSKSKSQIKREMLHLQKLGERLMELKEDQLQSLNDERLVEAIREGKRIKKLNARKRHLQFVGKLMRDTDLDAVNSLLDQHDNQSRQSVLVLHKVERWREALIEGDGEVMDEIHSQCPQVDHQHLRQLTRLAIRESTLPQHDMTHSRKLFRYLRELVNDSLM
jgi:ribosome-associated protein